MKAVRLLFYLFMIVYFSVNSCKKDDQQQSPEEIQAEQIREIISEQYLGVLKGLGMDIHEGTNPPNVEGIYLKSPNRLLISNIPGESPNTLYTDSRIRFYEQNTNNFEIKLHRKSSATEAHSNTAVISGSGNAFTVYAMVKSESGENSAIFAYLYSGVMNGTSISDLKRGFINVDDSNGGGSFISEGQARIVYDGDFISEQVPSMDPQAWDQPTLGAIEAGLTSSDAP